MDNRNIPTFTLTELENGQRITELADCLKNQGIFYLKDYGLSQLEQQRFQDITLQFFSNENETNNCILENLPKGVRRGFSKLEAESVAKVTNTGSYSDYSMCYSMGLNNNIYPKSVEGFENAWNNYFNIMYRGSRKMARIILKTAGCEENEDSIEKILDCDPLLRFRYFPEVPESRIAENEPLRMGPHYDISIITFVDQTPCKNGFVSLQCLTYGEYINVPYVPGTVVVICGSVTSVLTNGKVIAPTHRVRSPSKSQMVGSSRTSSVFFLRPKPSFKFSVTKAKEIGLDISLPGETGTFEAWLTGNYINMHNVKST